MQSTPPSPTTKPSKSPASPAEGIKARLLELKEWEKEGLVSPERAEVLATAILEQWVGANKAPEEEGSYAQKREDRELEPATSAEGD
jgi:hypothetical protein